MIILYQAYGLKESYQQVLFSILTLYYHLQGKFEGYRLVIYTDKPGLFSTYSNNLPISIEMLNNEMIQSYRGSSNFVHRAKICILKDCFVKYRTDIFYLDADTYFTQSPEELFQNIKPGVTIMNSNDYDLVSADEIFEDLNWLRIRRVIRDYSYTLENSTFKIPMTTRMWNAGVIGLSYHDKDLLDQVLDLSDQIYNNKKVFTAEQFAFSYVLQNKTTLFPSGEVIFHYWPNFEGKLWKQTYSSHFRRFFKQHKQSNLQEQALNAFKLTQLHDQLMLSQKTLGDRILRRLKLIVRVAVKGK